MRFKKRRHLLAGLVGSTLARSALAQKASVLRFIQQAALTSLDTLWGTASVTRNHSFLMFDQLYGLVETLTPWPQWVAGPRVEDHGRGRLVAVGHLVQRARLCRPAGGAEKKRLAREMQTIVFTEAFYVPPGHSFAPIAFHHRWAKGGWESAMSGKLWLRCLCLALATLSLAGCVVEPYRPWHRPVYHYH